MRGKELEQPSREVKENCYLKRVGAAEKIEKG